ncbi:alkaline phosphatase D family protein [uncultured Aquimarina sp.]|uniref:alkaline phosphatase D family protein n=1 Tax=uncultured Aquimarina sp. TaxID=575652 RepID=UPI00261E151F|nr:alkaline phosphatase D family protein [uncultured Aquimarina sp.]
MKTLSSILLVLFFTIHCAFCQDIVQNETSDFTIAFGSCNKQDNPQPFWAEILKKNQPNVFIWGGDNIYGDSDDMAKIENDYKIQNNNTDYQKLKNTVLILATWDDHDYGKSDAGVEWKMKRESQQLFYDFLGVPKDDPIFKNKFTWIFISIGRFYI